MRGESRGGPKIDRLHMRAGEKLGEGFAILMYEVGAT